VASPVLVTLKDPGIVPAAAVTAGPVGAEPCPLA
jgi:hypothetical protein